jgi:hypothetical protein
MPKSHPSTAPVLLLLAATLGGNGGSRPKTNPQFPQLRVAPLATCLAQVQLKLKGTLYNLQVHTWLFVWYKQATNCRTCCLLTRPHTSPHPVRSFSWCTLLGPRATHAPLVFWCSEPQALEPLKVVIIHLPFPHPPEVVHHLHIAHTFIIYHYYYYYYHYLLHHLHPAHGYKRDLYMVSTGPVPIAYPHQCQRQSRL